MSRDSARTRERRHAILARVARTVHYAHMHGVLASRFETLEHPA